METILKYIATQNCDYADCLASWRKCLSQKDKIISDKDFNKFWVNNYIRFDTCNPDERKQAGRKCTMEASMKKPIWDFNSQIISELKLFLKLFV